MSIVTFEGLPLLRANDPNGRYLLTLGCYDVGHPGYVDHFEYAKRLGGLLVVGIWSDEFVEHAKGPGRPVHRIGDRLKMVEAMRAVDMVVPMPPQYLDREAGARAAIGLLRPDVFVLGGEGPFEPGVLMTPQGGAVEVVADPTYAGKCSSTSGIIRHLGGAQMAGLDHTSLMPPVPFS
jgi:D-beta-D-heptose 7-phosphate kinase/D-beta-D-heptose 1-phosphate adenosyltransferase